MQPNNYVPSKGAEKEGAHDLHAPKGADPAKPANAVASAEAVSKPAANIEAKQPTKSAKGAHQHQQPPAPKRATVTTPKPVAGVSQPAVGQAVPKQPAATTPPPVKETPGVPAAGPAQAAPKPQPIAKSIKGANQHQQPPVAAAAKPTAFVKSSKSRERQQPSKGECEFVKNEKVDYEALKNLEFYHGFVARQDLASLLKNEGDYILRITEVDVAKEGDPVKYDLILSLMDQIDNDAMTMTTEGEQVNLRLRNVVIRKKKTGSYCIEMKPTFSTVKELVKWYATPGNKTDLKVSLKTPILPQFWEFKHSDLDFTGGKQLGQGAYGIVKSGKLNLGKRGTGGIVNVAVKIQKLAGGKDEKIGKEKMKEQMREARIMRNLEHKNVVRLFGVAVLEQPLYIILELINGGELKKYLIEQKAKGQKVGILEKVYMCRGAACGLEYLHRTGYIHRDIAARNCLYVPDGKLAKLSDFGLSRCAMEYTVTKAGAKLPTKWLSPETLGSLTFYDKSDVYSFGVMMYEIFVDGDEPWPKVSKPEVRACLGRGEFMQMPADCPPKLAKFIHKTIYVRDPEQRATSKKVAALLEELQTEMEASGAKGGLLTKIFPKDSKEKQMDGP